MGHPMSGSCVVPQMKWCSLGSLGLLSMQKGALEPAGRNLAGNAGGTGIVAVAVAVAVLVVVVVAVAVLVAGSILLCVLFVPLLEGVHAAVAGSIPLVVVLGAHIRTHFLLHRSNCYSLGMGLAAHSLKRKADAGVGFGFGFEFGFVVEFVHLV